MSGHITFRHNGTTYVSPWRIHYRRDRLIFEFLDPEDGVGHPPVWGPDPVHGCNGLCSREDFPGREPRPGDLALCGKMSLGLILAAGRQDIHYPDDPETSVMAWAGIHLDLHNSMAVPPGRPWSSRNPMIVGTISGGFYADAQ